ncbi:MAG TPA: hypothetical protein VGM90_33255 [Kofleriaceae bacterium]|jgi:hypothetical protein
MRTLIAVAVLNALVACQPRGAEPLEWPVARNVPVAPTSTPHRSSPPPTITEALPKLDLNFDAVTVQADPTRLDRWPLSMSEHIAFEPHFDIVNALAEPGMEWTRLCALGAHKRVLPPRLADQGRYLAGWCAALDHDLDRAIDFLAPLRTSVVSGMSEAVRADLATLLCQTGGADVAREHVAKYGLGRDLAVLDRLSAMYVELHQDEDALEISALAIANDNDTVPSESCTRFARRVALVPDVFRNAPQVIRKVAAERGEDAHLFPDQLLSDPSCRRLEAETTCWLDGNRCAAWWKENNVPESDIALAAATNLWPTSSNRVEQWLAVSRSASLQLPAPQAYELLLRSLRNAIKTTNCSDHEHRREIGTIATRAQSFAELPAGMLNSFNQFADTSKLCWPD